MTDASRADIIAARTAILKFNLRRGDALGAARAAARLRLPGVPLTREQHAMARRARRTVGQALLHARYLPTRYRDIIPAPAADAQVRRRLRAPRRRWLVALPIAALLIFVVLMLLRPSGPDGGGGAAAPDRPAGVIDVTQTLRGRTSAAPSVVAVVTAPPAATSTPGPVGTPATSQNPGSAGGGSGGTGAGGGGFGGDQTPPPGFRIFTLDVIDDVTDRGLPNVCVFIGNPTCDERHRTDASGRWTFPISSSETTRWDMQLTLVGYRTWQESFQVLPQDQPHKTVRMQRAS